MQNKLSPSLIGGVLVAVVLLIGVVYWWRVGRAEAGLPEAGQAGNQPPAIKGITPINPGASRPR